MQNVKSYFSSWKPFWKSSSAGCSTRTVTLAPSVIHFTNSSLGDLKHSIIDEKLMIDISTKLVESISPPKLQICTHNNQWFALNNSHLLVYRQLERIGLCTTVVCDIIRSQDVPMGIRQTLIPAVIPQQEQHCFPNSRDEHSTVTDDEGVQSQDEIIYCSDVQADSCGCLEGDEQYESSVVTGGDSDQDGDSDDEQSWPTNPSLSLTRMKCMSSNQITEIDCDDDSIEDSHKEMQSLL